MLRLSSRSARRIGTSYICTPCLPCHSTRSLAFRPALIPSHNGRHLSSTSRLLAPATETSTPNSTGADNIEPPPPEAPKKKKKKKPKQDEKSIAAQAEGERQLQVLQGALQALKNVLAAQNINVDQISKLGNQINLKDSEPEKTPKAKTKAKTKAKAKTKTESADNDEETQKSQGLSEKKETKRKSRRKASREEDVATADGAPEQAATSSGRSKRATKKAAGREKSKQKTASAKASKGQARPKKGTSSSGLRERTGNVVDSGDVWGDYKIIGEDALEGSEAQESGKGTKSKKKPPLDISTISANNLRPEPIKTIQPSVPGLSYGLDRVLFNPGVYHLQDPRSRVYNFDPYLSEIMPIQEFDFNALKQYVTSSKDSTLIGIAKEHGKRYTGSTSSMTSMLSHFHYLLSSWREINTSMLSKGFLTDSLQFTKIMKGPAAVFLHWKDGTYAIDADKEFDTANILSMLGKSMEKLLTLTKEEYERYRHINSDQITEEERNAEEAFHYTKFLDFMMRSQLDAHDPRVPGSGMFDLKTRAVVSIRMDAKGFHKGLGYEIRDRFGQWESFEREYYDMIRSAFLKYSLQVRMGRMDGIFVAFHNTQRIFGFQYIPISEMDLALHGTSNVTLGDREYKLSLALLNDILDRVSKKFPEQSLRLHVETRMSANAPFMYIFAKPVSQEDIDEVQNANRASIEAFEKEVLGLAKAEAEAEVEAEVEAEIEAAAEVEAEAEAEIEAESVDENEDVVQGEVEGIEKPASSQETSSLAAWNEVRQMVEDAVDDDEVGVGAVREAIEDALEQSGLLHAKSSTEARGYVDALLSAITNIRSAKPESTLSAPIEGEVTAGEDDPTSTQETTEPESEPSSEQSVPELELDTEQSQIEEESKHISSEGENADSQPEEIGAQQDDSLETQSESESFTSPVSNDEPTNAISELDSSASIEETASQVQADVNTTREVEEEEEDEEEDQEEDEDETEDIDDELEEGESKRDLNAASSMSPLKDLIVRMAQRIDERALSDQAEGSIDDSSKLKEFERILGQLIARSKEEQVEPRTDGTSSISGAPIEPGIEGQAEIPETGTEETEDTQGTSPESASEETLKDATPAEEEIDQNLLGLILTIRNKINGEYVTRPEQLTQADDWVVEYNIEEIPAKRAHTIYRQCQTRRRQVFEDTGNKESQWYKMFRGSLEERTMAGRKFRASETMKAQNRPVHVVGQEKSLKWEEVFGKPKAPMPTEGLVEVEMEDEMEDEHKKEE
ncbi:Pet127-domain-containing protein [Daldinia decipiens]|uniref:Pet127-domain-containing protein n=1 Tax=Daldinia decipiens TaxID=326647 RepID=UPI0020C2BE74|nr:Pet127-domain-containing protein [Daldinia decipiens]KAI1662938.1 Pet127-domain-containing protein [Daldinia decipiens]